ncbi:MAG: lipopolysaccharide biosynthesis protein [Methanobacteriota archaeon]|nr:MAG: lipopolysaccharide biosynthesis protein [Euryarchaeota archaeon]
MAGSGFGGEGTGGSVRTRTAENVAIIIAMQWVSRGFAVATKIVLARILFPADFGIFALAAGLIGFVSALGNFGLDYALIQRADSAKDQEYEVAMSLRVIISIVLLVATIALAIPWSSIFGNPVIAGATQALAIVYLIGPWSLIPTTRLTVKLAYRRLIVPNVLNQFTNSVVAISLAIMGFGFWSLVVALIASQLVWVVSLSVAYPWRPRFRFDRSVAKSLFAYSRHIIVASVLVFLMTNVDNFTVGLLLGSATLGYYAVAYSICLFSSMVSGSAATALFPTLSKIQEDLPRVRRGYLESFGYAIATVAPVSIGLAVMAPEIVLVLLGPVWRPSIVPLIILSFYGFSKAMVEFTTPLFASIGRPGAIPRLNAMILVGSLGLLPPLTILFGIAGTALAMTIPVPFALVVSFLWAARILQLQFNELAVRLRGPVVAAGIAGILALGFKSVIYSVGGQDVVVLGSATLVGTVAYFVSLKRIEPELYAGLGRHLRLLMPGFHE